MKAYLKVIQLDCAAYQCFNAGTRDVYKLEQILLFNLFWLMYRKTKEYELLGFEHLEEDNNLTLTRGFYVNGVKWTPILAKNSN